MKYYLQAFRRTVVRTVVTVTGTVAILEVTTRLPSQGRSSDVYHSLVDDWATPLLRRCLSPETAHTLAVECARRGWAPVHRDLGQERIDTKCTVTFDDNNHGTNRDSHGNYDGSRIDIKPLIVPNPVGLAAGFDKDGTIIEAMVRLGFGFVEVGTVCREPQPGNPSPRMFRLPSDCAIVNRYGFNSAGSVVVKENVRGYYNAPPNTSDDNRDQSLVQRLLQTAWRWLYPTIPAVGAVGMNLGKNKTSVTPDDVLRDYTSLIRDFGPYVDYLVVNISSPNTPNLRAEWQQDTQRLRSLLTACLAERDALATTANNGVPPLFVKLAPDLSDYELSNISTVLMDTNVNGIVVTNTTNQRPDGLIDDHHVAHESGGLSGQPLRDLSTETIRTLYALTHGTIPIVGVGGIATGQDAYDKLKAGASLVQLYTAMVYQGPGVVSKIRRELAELLVLHGESCVADVVGKDHEELHWKRQRERLQLQELTHPELYIALEEEDGVTEEDGSGRHTTDAQKQQDPAHQ